MNNKPQAVMITLRVAETEKEWFTTAEACKYLGMSERTLRTLRNAGRLRFYSLDPTDIHAHIFYRRRDMDRLFRPVT